MIESDEINASIDRGQHVLLVVDDNPATRYSTSRVLQVAGFRTVEAGSGHEALALARQGVSGVVLDVHLPDISGFDVCRQLRAAPETARMPVVHLSAEFTRNEDRVAGLDAGADAYLVHPVEPAVLVATLQALVRARTAEVRLEEQRQEVLEREQAARALAERHSRTKDDFIAVLSHELRTPLNAIMGWVAVLMRRDPAPEQLKGLQAIERNVKAQARIISDILDVARINSGKLTLHRESVDPAALLVNAVGSLRAQLDERGLQVDYDVEGAHAPAWLDAQRFEQVIWNLVTNAIKFSNPGGVIRVSLAREGERLVLVVRDEGQGIKAEFLPRLFDRFSQSDAPGQRVHGGLGLGLSIVQQLADLHGGSVSAHSEGLGKGTTFRVELRVDRADTDEHAAAQSGAAEPPPDTEGKELAGLDILVVEDDKDAWEMLTVVLTDRGATVRVAVDYDSALAAIDAARPDVLLSDIGLPVRDGHELIGELRRTEAAASRPRLPAVALTAFARSEDRARALRAGFDAHVAKPLTPHALVSAIQGLHVRAAR